MSETQKTEANPWWVNLARQTEEDRLEERTRTTQNRADRMRASAEEQQAEPAPRRRKGLRP